MDFLDLSGSWRAQRAEAAGLRFAYPDFDDSGYENIAVPSHWQESPAFRDYPETLIYRRNFEARFPRDGERAWLELDGLFYYAEAWLDGLELGAHEGYFSLWRVEVTKEIAMKRGHTLALRLSCPREKNIRKKRQITGVYGHWDAKNPDKQPGGIWLPPKLVYTSLACVKGLRISARPDGKGAALFSLALDVDSARSFPDARLEATIEGANFETKQRALTFSLPVASGERTYSAAGEIGDVQLWNVWDRGFPYLYRIRLALASGGDLLWAGEETFGVRTVEMDRLHLKLNGRRVFCRGTNYAPAKIRIADADDALVRDDVRLMREANVNCVRVHAHVAKESFYRACDEAGILIWQDFPLQWGYDRSVLKPAVRQIEAMCRRLFNRPSVALWCCHNAPFYMAATPDPKWLAILSTFYSMTVDRFNMDALDGALVEKAEEVDKTRPVVRHSGVLGFRFPHSEAHVYCGWYLGGMRFFKFLLKHAGQNFHFLTEYGAQSFPAAENLEEFGYVQNPFGPNWFDWDGLKKNAMLQPDNLHRWVPPESASSPEDYAAKTHEYQAEVIRFHNELCRINRFKPVGGALQFFFADSDEGVTWSVADWKRGIKPGYYALRDSFRPVTVIADWPAARYRKGQPARFQLYGVNDSLEDAEGAAVEWRFLNCKGETDREGSFETMIPANSVRQLKKISWKIPADEKSSCTLRLTIALPGREPFEKDYLLRV